MNRRTFLKSMFIFTAGTWVAKNGILRPAEARMNLAVVGGGVPAAYVTPNLWNERFEAADDGLDLVWDPGVAGTTVIVKANPADVGSPSGWKTQCIKFTAAAGGAVPSIQHYSFSSITTHYTRIEFVISSEGLANYDEVTFYAMRDGANLPIWMFTIDQSAGALRLKPAIYYDGSTHAGTNAALATSTFYRLETKWDVANHLYEWKLNGTSVDSGSLTTGHGTGLGDLKVGAIYTDNAITIYADNVGVNSNGWIGAAAP